MALGEQVAEDYRALRLSLRAHPLALIRDTLDGRGYRPCRELPALGHGRPARVAGLVTVRQRPGSANGVIFVTIEDESATANLIVWPGVFELHRRAVLGAVVLGVRGRVQREGRVIHVVAERLFDLTPLLDGLDGAAVPAAGVPDAPGITVPSRNFH